MPIMPMFIFRLLISSASGSSAFCTIALLPYNLISLQYRSVRPCPVLQLDERGAPRTTPSCKVSRYEADRDIHILSIIFGT
jgi:hypothetical protein